MAHPLFKDGPLPPVFFRIKPEIHARLNKVLVSHSGSRNDLARDALLREIERLEAKASNISPLEAKAIADFRKLTGQDPVAVLRAATKAHLAKA